MLDRDELAVAAVVGHLDAAGRNLIDHVRRRPALHDRDLQPLVFPEPLRVGDVEGPLGRRRREDAERDFGESGLRAGRRGGGRNDCPQKYDGAQAGKEFSHHAERVAQIEFVDVGVSYKRRGGGETVALEQTSLTIAPGEFICIVGPSGCGKTTLLHCLDGLHAPTSGEIRIDGRVIHGPGRDRAMVFQSASLMPWRTVLRNVTYGLEMQGVALREALPRAQAMVELVGLAGFEDRHPGELSGGMQQRVNLARALVTDPDVILLDEPFAALDAQTREQMQTELLRVWDETKKNAVFITHLHADHWLGLPGLLKTFDMRAREQPLALP